MRLIDADALTKRLIAFCNKNCPYTAKERNVMCDSCFMGLALEAVEDAPTIEPEQKKGTWLVHLYKLGRDRYECDQCQGRCDMGYRYCPNCGADMQGDSE